MRERPPALDVCPVGFGVNDPQNDDDTLIVPVADRRALAPRHSWTRRNRRPECVSTAPVGVIDDQLRPLDEALAFDVLAAVDEHETVARLPR